VVAQGNCAASAKLKSRLGFLSPGDLWLFFADRSFSKNFSVASDCVETAKRRTE
jgi:hypothetical protein